MGVHQVQEFIDVETRVKFINHLLKDVEALEYMLENGWIEDDIVRIGAEQELCLVTDTWRPSKKGIAVLQAIDDAHFTTEIARYNLEINLDPVELKKACFSKVESQLRYMLAKAGKAAQKHANKILLTGILPTVSKNELHLEYMTPIPRYNALNTAIKELRGADPQLHIRGIDELSIIHDSVLFEACNTSFQMHLQVSPKDFIPSYNWAQAISGPVLGVCANSPLLLGRELWSETRIALFQQSIDTRNSSYALKHREARVSFAHQWATGSIAEIFKNDISNHEVMLTTDSTEDSLEEIKKGNIPKLKALNLHNGTIYRWNRPCYGVGGGRPHVRIENRYIPSGPTVLDEMANFVFWVGLMMGRPSKYDHMPDCMDFKDVKGNFIKSARTGKASMMLWEENLVPVRDLVLKELLPIAYSGLKNAAIDSSDINRYLGIIEQRVQGTTGAQWQIANYRNLQKKMKQDDALVHLTKGIYQYQQTKKPVHRWSQLQYHPGHKKTAYLSGHIMSTQLLTVNENDVASLAMSIMRWKNVHHIPVENNIGELQGLLTWSHMEAFGCTNNKGDDRVVAHIMIKEVITVLPETEISKAIELMKFHDIGCLPVVQENKVIGIITEKDISDWSYDEGV
ncbi:MAG: CBS domain-containing protein [Bacteroidota bacterium]